MSAVVIDFFQEKLLRSYDGISKAIIDYISEMGLEWEIESARRLYFGHHITTIGSDNTNLNYKPFIQWLIFSYKLDNGLSLIENIYDNCMNKMNCYEKEAVISLKNTYESLYKVYSVEEDKLLVKDVFSQKMMYVWDSLLVCSVKRYVGVFMRVVNINGKNLPIPGYCVLSNSFLKDTQQYIIEKFKEYSKGDKEIQIHGFLSRNSLMMHKYFLYSVNK